ncbi:MAG: response regulator [SAR324 cluster bacterium]|nr:response regulator [SAR324 cluster bacterium]
MEQQTVIRVLLVDDSEDDCFITRMLVEDIHETLIELQWCATFEQALVTSCQAPHDICLIDYQLGARTGIELFGSLVFAVVVASIKTVSYRV